MGVQRALLIVTTVLATLVVRGTFSQSSPQVTLPGTILEQNNFLLARVAALEAAQLSRVQDDEVCQARLREVERLQEVIEQHDVARGNWVERFKTVQKQRADEARRHKEEVRRLEQTIAGLREGGACNVTAIQQACQREVEESRKAAEKAQEQAVREEKHHNQTRDLWEEQLEVQNKTCLLKVELAAVQGNPSTQDPCESSNAACGPACNYKFKAACARFSGIVSGLRAQLEECKKGA